MKHLKKFENFYLNDNDIPESEESDEQSYLDRVRKMKEVSPSDDCDDSDGDGFCDDSEEEVEVSPRRRTWGDEVLEEKKKTKEEKKEIKPKGLSAKQKKLPKVMENTGQGASEIHAAIKELVDRDGTTQAAYSLLNMALKKINDDKGMFWIPKSELTKNLLASIEQLLNQKRYDEAYLISHSHAKRIKKDFDEAGGYTSEVRKLVKDIIREQDK